MSARTVLVGTSGGVDGAKALAGRKVGPFVTDASSIWALVDSNEVWRLEGSGTWRQVATWDGPALACLARSASGLVAGTAGAHLLVLGNHGLEIDPTFDDAEGRDHWYTPWGAPADTRSIASVDDSVLVNVHVGGVARRDGDGPWRALVDVDVDVHQVTAAPDGSILLATGAAGFGRSTDGGASWSWDALGLHGSYCRAVVVAGDAVLLSASTGPRRTRGAVYRRPLGAQGPWKPVSDMLPGNIDTFWLAASGDDAAFVTADGNLWTSTDTGSTWSVSEEPHPNPRGVVVGRAG